MNTTINIALGVLLIASGIRELCRLLENRKTNSNTLKEKTNINTLKEQIANVRDNIESDLLAMLKNNDIKNIDFGEMSSTPIIANERETYTLTQISLIRLVSGSEYIMVNGSSEYESIALTAKDMDIEYLIGVYEWVINNIDEWIENE